MGASGRICGLAAVALSMGLGAAAPAGGQPYGYGAYGYRLSPYVRVYSFRGGYRPRYASYARQAFRNAMASCGSAAGRYGETSRVIGAERVGSDWYRVDGVIVVAEPTGGRVVYDDSPGKADRSDYVGSPSSSNSSYTSASSGYDDGVGFDEVAEARSRAAAHSADPPERYYNHAEHVRPAFHYETPSYVRYETGFTCIARGDGRIDRLGFDR